MAEPPALLSARLTALRDAGWSVAVHNDYRLSGARHTFWLFTNAATGRFAKGEGFTDEEAIDNVMQVIGSIMCEEREVCRKLAPKPEPRADADWYFSATSTSGDTVEAKLRDDGAVALGVRQGFSVAGVALECTAARRLRDLLTRILADEPRAEGERCKECGGAGYMLVGDCWKERVTCETCHGTGAASQTQGQEETEEARAARYKRECDCVLCKKPTTPEKAAADEVACVVCGAWHESDVLLSRSSNECARELRQDLAEARIQLAAYAQGRELDLISSRESGRDKTLPEDEAISAAFPTRTGKHELYAEAMRLVGAKHSKGALVALVNWLLTERDRVST